MDHKELLDALAEEVAAEQARGEAERELARAKHEANELRAALEQLLRTSRISERSSARHRVRKALSPYSVGSTPVPSLAARALHEAQLREKVARGATRDAVVELLERLARTDGES